MRITGVATAFPPNRYSQQEIFQALGKNWADKLDKPQVLERLHSRVGVDHRHLALTIPEYDNMLTFGDSNNAWIRVAEQLGEKALCRALHRAGISATELDALFFVSVTGMCSPSIDARLVNKMKLSPNIKRIPIFGLGCVAGAAGIARAADYVKAYPDHHVALLSVELCSLTWQRDDLSVANLISSGLFGDGAAAVIISGKDKAQHGPRVVATRSVFYPDTQDVMGWDISEKGFRIVLSQDVPTMVHDHLRGDVDSFLAEFDLKRSDIATWIMHTGGPKVLEATEQSLELPEGALAPSWKCLSEVGNLSSASVLVVLENIYHHQRPAPGTLSVLAAMGPGFCAELVLLVW
ncbi:Chalcone and stilbene synthases-like protein [Candidatus Koribacter versatilis Ellin345]|uniref:Chalcone and stilbene synthases-like protein n=2 Tax=Candidatus Korobacter versatilis TaxID=658062 RepID=Q1ILZ4_KORVE|nr:Chalcone and stilbene synthases-like protein [Candidatus Koribacter versatilis Ellin345]